MSKAKFWISNHRFIVVIFTVLFAAVAVVALGVTYQRVFALPNILATKTDILANDVDGDLAADPGDTLEYDVVIANAGSTSAGNARSRSASRRARR